MRRRLAGLVVSVAVVIGASASAAAADGGRYVAIGDSIAGATNSYVDRYAARHAITDIQRFTSGETAAGAVTSVLPAALAAIGDATDTTVVTVQIGGHDYLTGNCNGDWNRPTCDFADGLHALLTRLDAALAADPGTERFLVLAYYNPASGRGDAMEQSIDVGLLGADGRLDTSAHGDAWGMTDVIGWLGCRHGAALVNPWAAFKAGGQALMADSLHPTAAGQEILTDLLDDPAKGGPAPSCPPTTPFAVTGPDAGDGQAHGVVEPRLAPARWWFEYGSTGAYGQSTPVSSLAASAGARAVTAELPSSPPGTVFHIRLVVANDRGTSVGEDRVVTIPEPPRLSASLRGSERRSRLLSRGVRLRIHCTGETIAVRGRLRRPGHDPIVLRAELAWTAGETRIVRVPLTARGRRLVRNAARPRIGLRLVATGPGGTSAPVRLRLSPR